MSKATVRIKYDGPALRDHEMDVAQLAPALMGLSDLCQAANRHLNGDRAAVKVLVRVDVEQQCFTFDITLVQSLWEHTKALLHHDEVRNAKELAEWIGLLTAATVGTSASLFQVWKWLRGRSADDPALEVRGDGDLVVLIFPESPTDRLPVRREMLELARDPVAIRSAQRVVDPVLTAGYSSLEFIAPDGVAQRVERDDAARIRQIPVGSTPKEETAIDEPQVITAHVRVYSPVYDAKAPQWRFTYGDQHHYMDISETDIAQRAIERGGALKDDLYRVRLETQQVVDENGREKVKYKIREVLGFRPARLQSQADWINDGDGGSGGT
jgi:hypothetical protein